MRAVEFRRLLGAAVLWLGAPVAQAAAITLTFSDVTGAQTFLNRNVGYAWYFSFSDTPAHDVLALFSMKKAAATTDTAVASIYRMDTNTLLGSATFSASSASSSSFQTVTFNLLSNYTFASGINYLLTLTSTADTGNKTWFIKEPEALQAVGSSTIRLANSPQIYDPVTTPVSSLQPPSPAPSPAPIALLGAAWLILLRLRRGRGVSMTRSGTRSFSRLR